MGLINFEEDLATPIKALEWLDNYLGFKPLKSEREALKRLNDDKGYKDLITYAHNALLFKKDTRRGEDFLYDDTKTAQHNLMVFIQKYVLEQDSMN